MAKFYLGIEPAAGPSTILIKTSINNVGAEIVLNDTKVLTKMQAVAAIDHLKSRVEAGEWPPLVN